jgi:hypothetical protein
MRSAKLFIVAIDGKQGPLEVQTSATGLYTKYSARQDVNKEVEVVYLSRNGTVRDNMGCGKVNIADGDTLGMYVVAHCGDFSTAVWDHNLAVGIKKFLDTRAAAAPYKLDKCCLVVCNGAKDPPELSKPLSEGGEAALIRQFAKLLSDAGLKPRLAGWTGYVTVDPGGKKKIISSSTIKEGFASDMSISRAKQKMVYVWEDSSGYVRKDFEAWSDK